MKETAWERVGREIATKQAEATYAPMAQMVAALYRGLLEEGMSRDDALPLAASTVGVLMAQLTQGNQPKAGPSA